MRALTRGREVPAGLRPRQPPARRQFQHVVLAPRQLTTREIADRLYLPEDGRPPHPSLATRGVSASTQNQALSAILFLYDVVVGQRLAWMNDIVRAQRPVRLPVVLSREEVAALLSHLSGPVWLMASLMYGAGLRLLECAELRVKDIAFDRGELVVRDGKGGKDRVAMLPGAMKGPLVAHLPRVKAQHEADEAAWCCRARASSEAPERAA